MRYGDVALSGRTNVAVTHALFNGPSMEVDKQTSSHSLSIGDQMQWRHHGKNCHITHILLAMEWDCIEEIMPVQCYSHTVGHSMRCNEPGRKSGSITYILLFMACVMMRLSSEGAEVLLTPCYEMRWYMGEKTALVEPFANVTHTLLVSN